MERELRGIRGAVCVRNDADDITEWVCAMCNDIFARNGLRPDDIVSVLFSMTKDIDAMNAAAALRHGSACIDVSRLAMLAVQEAEIENMLPRTVRVLVTAYVSKGAGVHHSYLNGAEVLRPGFANT